MRFKKILIFSLCVLLLVPSVAYAADLQDEFTREYLEILKEKDPAEYEALMNGERQDEFPLPPSAQLHQEQMEQNSVTIEWGVIIVQSLIATILIYTIPVTIYKKLKRGKDEDRYKEKDPWER